MIIDFTKIKWAGEENILITNREESQKPILILNKDDIKKLNEEWKSNKIVI